LEFIFLSKFVVNLFIRVFQVTVITCFLFVKCTSRKTIYVNAYDFYDAD
jgi:hypothetical protein